MSKPNAPHIGFTCGGDLAGSRPRHRRHMDDGHIIEMNPGDLFYIAPGHDSWFVGDEPYVSLHLMGATDYAAHKQ